jgi:hypothetical protein
MLFFPSRSSKPHWKKIDLLRLYMQGPLKHEKRAEDLEFGGRVISIVNEWTLSIPFTNEGRKRDKKPANRALLCLRKGDWLCNHDMQAAFPFYLHEKRNMK